jgi:hypothetical protein
MSTYSLINNGDTGLQARTKINAIITEVNNTQFFGATGSTTTTSSVELASIPMTGYNGAVIKIDAFGYGATNSNAVGITSFHVFKLFDGGLEPVSTADLYLKTDFTTATLEVTATNDESIEIRAVGQLDTHINWAISYSVLKSN